MVARIGLGGTRSVLQVAEPDARLHAPVGVGRVDGAVTGTDANERVGLHGTRRLGRPVGLHPAKGEP